MPCARRDRQRWTPAHARSGRSAQDPARTRGRPLPRTEAGVCAQAAGARARRPKRARPAYGPNARIRWKGAAQHVRALRAGRLLRFVQLSSDRPAERESGDCCLRRDASVLTCVPRRHPRRESARSPRRARSCARARAGGAGARQQRGAGARREVGDGWRGRRTRRPADVRHGERCRPAQAPAAPCPRVDRPAPRQPARGEDDDEQAGAGRGADRRRGQIESGIRRRLDGRGRARARGRRRSARRWARRALLRDRSASPTRPVRRWCLRSRHRSGWWRSSA